VKKLTVEEILNGIRVKNNDILRFIYFENYPTIKKYILENSGNIQDAEDIFQEAIVRIFRKLLKRQISLNCSFKTYLYSVCRILWLKELEKKQLIRNDNLELEKMVESEEKDLFENGDTDKNKIIQEHLMRLDEKCRQILILFYDGASIEEITEIMGFGSTGYTRKKKLKCKEKLIENLKKDPRF
jgi:RNA polymerase sigma factor (sigma-70 family)